MKCCKCEQTFKSLKLLRWHMSAGHPAYMRKVGRAFHQTSSALEAHERAAWGVHPGMAMYTGKRLAKRKYRDADDYRSRTEMYKDPMETLVRYGERDLRIITPSGVDNAA